MGSSAKITRGGNKKRINQGRQEAKLRAQGAKGHTTSVKESVEARRRLKQRAMAIADELKANAAGSSGSGGGAPTARAGRGAPVGSGGATIVRMAPRASAAKKTANAPKDERK